MWRRGGSQGSAAASLLIRKGHFVVYEAEKIKNLYSEHETGEGFVLLKWYRILCSGLLVG